VADNLTDFFIIIAMTKVDLVFGTDIQPSSQAQGFRSQAQGVANRNENATMDSELSLSRSAMLRKTVTAPAMPKGSSSKKFRNLFDFGTRDLPPTDYTEALTRSLFIDVDHKFHAQLCIASVEKQDRLSPAIPGSLRVLPSALGSVTMLYATFPAHSRLSRCS
jgi:hypothetical protein